ncbi:MAG: hypothetical protein H8E62_00695, partial [Planctomycetes bacterium]|nr:hypothetical protein [Planctomycetota bacterium]
MSSEEVKTENSSQEEKTYSEDQFKGLLADKQAEVRKRQDAEKQIADLAKQVETLTSRTSRANEETGEQDRPLTVGQFQKLMAEQNKLNAENAFAQRNAESERKALSELTAEKCGDGLDYASVIAAGEANLTEGDRLAIKAAKDPAAEKYRRCVMLTPELSEKSEAVRTSKLLENIKLTGKVPAAGGGTETSVTPDEVS